MARTSRWCLDLNIWCASLLADLKGSQGSACQTLVDIVRKGHYQDTTVDLVISWCFDRVRYTLGHKSDSTSLPLALLLEQSHSSFWDNENGLSF